MKKNKRNTWTCKDGKGCTKGMVDYHDNTVHMVHFDKSFQVTCACWMPLKKEQEKG